MRHICRNCRYRSYLRGIDKGNAMYVCMYDYKDKETLPLVSEYDTCDDWVVDWEYVI